LHNIKIDILQSCKVSEWIACRIASCPTSQWVDALILNICI